MPLQVIVRSEVVRLHENQWQYRLRNRVVRVKLQIVQLLHLRKEHFQYIKRFWDMVEDARINGIPDKKKKPNAEENKIDMTQFTGTQGVKPANVEIDFNS